MSVLAHKWVASGALNGQKAFARARVCVVLHGIMGQGRNWMQAAKALVDAVPTYKVLLVDHRGHGANGATKPDDSSGRKVASIIIFNKRRAERLTDVGCKAAEIMLR